MTRKKQAYRLRHKLSHGGYGTSFWERRLLSQSEANRLVAVFGSDALEGPYSAEDCSIVSGYRQD